MNQKVVYKCPVPKCEWELVDDPIAEMIKNPSYSSPFGFDNMIVYRDMAEVYMKVEIVLNEHLKTHPRWRIPRKVRKAMNKSSVNEKGIRVGMVLKAHHRTGWRHRYWKDKFKTVEAN